MTFSCLNQRFSHSSLALALLLGLVASGCTGEIRESTTARTATEQLLVSTAAERAVSGFEEQVKKVLSGKRVAIDESRLDAVDKNYLVSAVRNLLSRNNVRVVPNAKKKYLVKGGQEVELEPQYVLELRSGALGIKDSDFGLGIPPLPIPVPNTNLTSIAPGLYLFYRNKQEGWAKFQFWIYEPSTDSYLAQTGDLWGRAYYTKWTFFGIGPFDFSEDVYPETGLLD